VTEDHLDGEVLRRTLRYAIERRRLEGEAHRRSVVDEVTGVYNARGFEHIGVHHLHLAARTKEPVVLVFVRLDPGRDAGADQRDGLMRDAARVLSEAVREADVIGRLGPDTFGVLLAGDATGAEAAVLSRIVEAVATRNARAGRSAPLALSLGSAAHDPERPSSLADLIREADARMQRGGGPAPP
jgi:diguanylate cyclase (GGDEF)-like protein